MKVNSEKEEEIRYGSSVSSSTSSTLSHWNNILLYFFSSFILSFFFINRLIKSETPKLLSYKNACNESGKENEIPSNDH